MAIRTLKVPYICLNADFVDAYNQLEREQANVIRLAFNRASEGSKEKEIRSLCKTYNNIPKDSWFIQSGIKSGVGSFKSAEARGNEHVCFGRNAFLEFQKGKITKEELKESRRFGIYSIGENIQKGNRKFNFISNNLIQFKPQKGACYDLELKAFKNHKKILTDVFFLANQKELPITIKMTKKHLMFSFDFSYLSTKNYIPKKDRVLGLDTNPNRVGYVIKDSNKIFKSESLDLFDLRLFSRRGKASSSDEKKYRTNKKKHEITQIAHYLVNQAQAMHCEAISVEKLTNSNVNTGNRHLNRSINNDSNKSLLFGVLEKLCALKGIKFIEILSPYTSFFGGAKYGDLLPDPLCAAAVVADAGIIETKRSRTGTKRIAWFNTITGTQLKSIYGSSSYLSQWKQTDLNFTSMKALYNSVKLLVPEGKMYLSYHLPLDPKDPKVQNLRFCTKQSQVQKYLYIL